MCPDLVAIVQVARVSPCCFRVNRDDDGFIEGSANGKSPSLVRQVPELRVWPQRCDRRGGVETIRKRKSDQRSGVACELVRPRCLWNDERRQIRDVGCDLGRISVTVRDRIAKGSGIIALLVAVVKKREAKGILGERSRGHHGCHGHGQGLPQEMPRVSGRMTVFDNEGFGTPFHLFADGSWNHVGRPLISSIHPGRVDEMLVLPFDPLVQNVLCVMGRDFRNPGHVARRFPVDDGGMHRILGVPDGTIPDTYIPEFAMGQSLPFEISETPQRRRKGGGCEKMFGFFRDERFVATTDDLDRDLL